MKTFFLIFLLFALLLAAFFYSFYSSLDPRIAAISFINSNFISKDGAVLLQSTDKDLVFSESAGLYLQVCAQLKDRIAFDKTYSFVKRELISAKGVLFWKIDLKSKVKVSSSASIDDLRMVRVLLTAYSIWHDESYLKEALAIAGALKKYEVSDGLLVDFFDWQAGDNTSKKVNISYLDLLTMQELANFDADWKNIYNNSKELLLTAMTEDGLFQEVYDLQKNKFSYEVGNMINQLLSALALSESGVPDAEIKTYLFLRRCLDKDGAIFNAYNIDATPKDRGECTAVYALSARLFNRAGDRVYAKKALSRMNSFQVRNRADKFFGGFGSFSPDQAKVFNSFDCLQALLTIIDK